MFRLFVKKTLLDTKHSLFPFQQPNYATSFNSRFGARFIRPFMRIIQQKRSITPRWARGIFLSRRPDINNFREDFDAYAYNHEKLDSIASWKTKTSASSKARFLPTIRGTLASVSIINQQLFPLFILFRSKESCATFNAIVSPDKVGATCRKLEGIRMMERCVSPLRESRFPARIDRSIDRRNLVVGDYAIMYEIDGFENERYQSFI